MAIFRWLAAGASLSRPVRLARAHVRFVAPTKQAIYKRITSLINLYCINCLNSDTGIFRLV